MAGTSGIFARPCRLSPSSQALSTEGVCDQGTSPRDQSDGQAGHVTLRMPEQMTLSSRANSAPVTSGCPLSQNRVPEPGCKWGLQPRTHPPFQAKNRKDSGGVDPAWPSGSFLHPGLQPRLQTVKRSSPACLTLGPAGPWPGKGRGKATPPLASSKPRPPEDTRPREHGSRAQSDRTQLRAGSLPARPRSR